MKRKRILYALVLVLILIFYFGCSEEGSIMDEVKPVVYGKVTDTFTGEPIEGVLVSVRSFDGEEFEAETDEDGRYEIELEKEGAYIVFFNFDMGKEDYIPSVLIRRSEFSTEKSEDFFPISGERVRINMDLVKRDDIFLRSVIESLKKELKIGEDEAIKSILDAYRGRGSLMYHLNAVWVKQPEKFIVYDPHGYLRDYEDERRNPIFDNIMEGFKAIEEYTSGVIKAPKRDEVEIRESGGDTDYAIYFEITDGRAYAGESVNDYNEIVRSGAGGAGWGLSAEGAAGELIASVQGGDNESALDTVFDGNPMNDYDRLWGKFNYKKREPGAGFVLDKSLYGFIFETRAYDELTRLERL